MLCKWYWYSCFWWTLEWIKNKMQNIVKGVSERNWYSFYYTKIPSKCYYLSQWSTEPTKNRPNNRPKRLVSFRLNTNGVFEKTTKKSLKTWCFQGLTWLRGRDLNHATFGLWADYKKPALKSIYLAEWDSILKNRPNNRPTPKPTVLLNLRSMLV